MTPTTLLRLFACLCCIGEYVNGISLSIKASVPTLYALGSYRMTSSDKLVACCSAVKTCVSSRTNLNAVHLDMAQSLEILSDLPNEVRNVGAQASELVGLAEDRSCFSVDQFTGQQYRCRDIWTRHSRTVDDMRTSCDFESFTRKFQLWPELEVVLYVWISRRSSDGIVRSPQDVWLSFVVAFGVFDVVRCWWNYC